MTVRQSMEKFKKVLKWLNLILRCILIAVLLLLAVYNVTALVQRYVYQKGIATVFGIGTAVVVSGSMSPTIEVNDMVVIKACDSYEVDDIVTFYDSSAGEYITHRIIKISDSGTYTTQGDANNTQDDFSVTNDAIVGKVIFVVAGVGGVISFLQTPIGLLIVLAAGIAIWFLLDFISNRTDKKDKKEEDSNRQND